MTNEELTQKMEFIVEQQAQFPADIEVMREVHAADTKLFKEESKLGKQQIHSLSAAVTAVVGMVGRLSEGQEETNNKLSELQARADASFAELAAAGARSEERLNIFINVVERHLGGNGSQGPANRS